MILRVVVLPLRGPVRSWFRVVVRVQTFRCFVVRGSPVLGPPRVTKIRLGQVTVRRFWFIVVLWVVFTFMILVTKPFLISVMVFRRRAPFLIIIVLLILVRSSLILVLVVLLIFMKLRRVSFLPVFLMKNPSLWWGLVTVRGSFHRRGLPCCLLPLVRPVPVKIMRVVTLVGLGVPSCSPDRGWGRPTFWRFWSG